MNETEHLLTVLTEECAEVTQRACKAARFGLAEIQPGQSEDNKRRIEKELADLVATAELLGLIIRDEDKAAKREKLKKFMDYARSLGTLDRPEAWAICGWCAGTGKEERTSVTCPKCAGAGGKHVEKPIEPFSPLCDVQTGCFGGCGKLLPCPDHTPKIPPTTDSFVKFLEENCPGDDAHSGASEPNKPLLERCSMCASLYEAYRKGMRTETQSMRTVMETVCGEIEDFGNMADIEMVALMRGVLAGKKKPESPGVFCLEHRKVMVDGVCLKCVNEKRLCLHPGTFRGEKCKLCGVDVR